jgi:ATP-dependent helicase/nuclease subunit A
VQLLTVHGVKGLEARAVFVMDAAPEAQKPQHASVLVDWPVDAMRPRRFAFVASESACAPSLVPLLQHEVAARQREELNGLYVAMTRATRQLFFRAPEPWTGGASTSWWQRVAPVAQGWDPGPAPAEAVVPSGPLAAGAAPVRLTVIEPLPAPDASSGPIPAPAGADAPGDDSASKAPAVVDGVGDDSASKRLGRAVHRVLEWATARGPLGDAQVGDLAAAAAAEFGAPAAVVARTALAVLRSPSFARFLHGAAIVWSGNEVPAGDGDELLRIDRLVCLQEAQGPVWWVLDYKLAHARVSAEDHRAQLLRYRAAVQRAQPGDAVRCAVVTGSGEVVELD